MSIEGIELHIEDVKTGDTIVVTSVVVDGEIDQGRVHSGWPLKVKAVSAPFILASPIGGERIGVVDARCLRFSKVNSQYLRQFKAAAEQDLIGLNQPQASEPEPLIDDCICPICGGVFGIADMEDGQVWQCNQCKGVICVPPDEASA